MCREGTGRRGKKTGKRFLISISCLILLSLDLLCLTYAAGLGIEGDYRPKEREASFRKSHFGIEDTKEDEVYRAALREMGGFDNPIDDLYLSMLCYGDEANRYSTLEAYEGAWREQLSHYVKECEGKDGSFAGQKAAGAYGKAVFEAVYAQKNLMEYMGVEQEKILWYSAQIYRCAFVKDIKGKFRDNDMTVIALSGSEGRNREIPVRAYEVYGEFENEAADAAVFLESQESFDISWCNQLCQLTMEFYEDLDEEGKRLAGIWQESRENWKRASNECLQSLMWEPGAEAEAVFCEDEEIFAGMMERDGWINRLYVLQLQCMQRR